MSSDLAESPAPLVRRLLAWGVHLYTGAGLLCAAAMARAIHEGGPGGFRAAFAWMLAATAIDATDGALARLARVKETLPGFDGRRLDDIVDFLTYAFLPLLLVARAGLLPTGGEGWLATPLLAAAYGFGQVHIKTPDGSFLGFPSCWNVVALYLFALGMPGAANLAVLLIFSLLTFVPLRYPYPSQPGPINRLALVLGLIWSVALVVLVARLGPPGSAARDPLLWASLLYPAFYGGAAAWTTARRRGRQPSRSQRATSSA